MENTKSLRLFSSVIIISMLLTIALCFIAGHTDLEAASGSQYMYSSPVTRTFRAHDGTTQSCYVFEPAVSGSYKPMILFTGLGGMNNTLTNFAGYANRWAASGTVDNYVYIIPAYNASDASCNPITNNAFCTYINTHPASGGRCQSYFGDLLDAIENGTVSSKINTSSDITVCGWSLGGCSSLFAGCEFHDRVVNVGALSPSWMFFNETDPTRGWINGTNASERLVFSSSPNAHLFMSAGHVGDSEIVRYNDLVRYNTAFRARNIIPTVKTFEDYGRHEFSFFMEEMYMFLYFIQYDVKCTLDQVNEAEAAVPTPVPEQSGSTSPSSSSSASSSSSSSSSSASSSASSSTSGSTAPSASSETSGSTPSSASESSVPSSETGSSTASSSVATESSTAATGSSRESQADPSYFAGEPQTSNTSPSSATEGSSATAASSDTEVAGAQRTGAAGFVSRLYTVALGRSADSEGLQNWVNSISSGENTGADVARGFLYSNEFLGRNISNEDFVRTLYMTFFDRQADEGGLNAWTAALDGGADKRDIIEGFINSAEWSNVCLRYGIRSGGSGAPTATVEPNQATVDFATRLYTTCLCRTADQEGLMAWARQLANQRETGTGAAAGFFFSAEFINRDVSDEEYVTRLYRTFMGREPDTEGYNAWVAQLESGVSRQEVFRGFSASPEFGVICSQYGIIR